MYSYSKSFPLVNIEYIKMIQDIRYINIGNLPNGALAPLATHPNATNANPKKPSIATVSLQCNQLGEITGILNFAGSVQASLQIAPDASRVLAYTLFNANPSPWLQESTENICKAFHLFMRVISNEVPT